ncbi:hypothetical protein [Hungatella effluvii]|nr:hypothetical protein [Hungatella hathewayi]
MKNRNIRTVTYGSLAAAKKQIAAALNATEPLVTLLSHASLS